MASSPRKLTSSPDVLLRIGSREFDRLREVIFCRYPDKEWATFARFGWRASSGSLVLTLAMLDEPEEGDLDQNVEHVAIQEQYTLRIALAAETHPLCVGIIHSHPQGFLVSPSTVDDDMDAYYAEYFESFASSRPYVSLIIEQHESTVSISGRIHTSEGWSQLSRVWVEGSQEEQIQVSGTVTKTVVGVERFSRLTGALGKGAAERLQSSTVAVIGAGGTGSAAIEVLARAGVGRLVIVDPETIEESNLERVHGAIPSDVSRSLTKVEIAMRHVKSINTRCEVTALVGSIPQPRVVDEMVKSDVLLGCSDQQHSRLAASDLAFRYLVPYIDAGVALEGKAGRVTGQVVQLVRFLPNDPCALCRRMINPLIVAQELMPPEEIEARLKAAKDAAALGGDANPYWREQPILNTVGYITTLAGALVAGYAIGLITRKFAPPFEHLQMNLSAPLFDVVDIDQASSGECNCNLYKGWADQAEAHEYVSPPPHWAQAYPIEICTDVRYDD